VALLIQHNEVQPLRAAGPQRLFAELMDAVDSLPELCGPVGGPGEIDDLSSIAAVVRGLHRTNATQWAREDDVRRADATDAEIGALKRVIDELNLRRHRFTELIDDYCLDALPQGGGGELHTETIGMIVDRLSVLALREHHVGIRGAAAPSERLTRSLEDIRQQRADLRTALAALIRRCRTGESRFRVYRAHKLYGDGGRQVTPGADEARA
jgi:uncharacterized protein DUF4254